MNQTGSSTAVMSAVSMSAGAAPAASAAPAPNPTAKYVPPYRRRLAAAGIATDTAEAAGPGGIGSSLLRDVSSGGGFPDNRRVGRGDTLQQRDLSGGRALANASPTAARCDGGANDGRLRSNASGSFAPSLSGAPDTGAASRAPLAMNTRWKMDSPESATRMGSGGDPSGFTGRSGSGLGNRANSTSVGSGRGGGFSAPKPSGRPSKTGTGWDVRDNRPYQEEEEGQIFAKDKDKSAGINFDSYDSIPVELTGPDSESIEPIKSFSETASVHPLIAANIARVKYERPTPVQKYSIPSILAGRDLLGCAQTGSGKTAAFLFPLITRLLNEGPPPSSSGRSYSRPAHPVVLVLSPTRELTIQIYEESRKFAFGTGIKTVAVYGGSEMSLQYRNLGMGCDICVATPGRLQDLMKRNVISMEQAMYLVLDEADRMLDMGFAPQIYDIVQGTGMPTPEQGRQTIMFSATFPRQIQNLATEFLRNHLFLTVGRVGSTNDFIVQNIVYATDHDKPRKLLSILENSRGQLVLVFVETKRKVAIIESFLQARQLPVVSLHGDKCQEDREKALDLFRTGRKPIMIATDVASRGLDIHNIGHVVNCDMPKRIDDYVHRIGRTGRAGNGGMATSMVNEEDGEVLRDLLQLQRQKNGSGEVPSWFYDLVVKSSSAHRGGFSGGSHGGMFKGTSRSSPGSGGFGRSPPAFGARDSRPNNSTSFFDAGRDIGRGAESRARAGKADDNEDADGW